MDQTQNSKPRNNQRRGGNNNRRRNNNGPSKPMKKVQPTKLKKKEDLENSLLSTLQNVHENGPATTLD